MGIDSLERALVYAFLSLRASIVRENGQYAEDQRIKIGENTSDIDNALITFEAKIKYSPFLVNQNGGHLILYLTELNYTSLTVVNIDCPASEPNTPIMPITPSILVAFEQYLYWSAASLLASLPSDQKYIEIKKFEHNREGSYVQVKADLPFDYQKYLLGSNYICTVKRIADSYQLFDLPSGSIIDNSFTFDNESLLIN